MELLGRRDMARKINKKKILVLGTTGMLGAMIYHYLQTNKDFNVDGTVRSQIKKNNNLIKFSVEDFIKKTEKYSFLKEYDYIINCIGVIKPFCQDDNADGVKKAITINALFPHILADFLSNTRVKVIQIATDCVFDGTEGNYKESDKHNPTDVYGKTKSLGEVKSKNFLHIRCSIIGPKTKENLLEWFLAQKPHTQLNGFAHHKWNGVTTLQFAQLCEQIINYDAFNKLQSKSPLHHFTPNTHVTKYELLIAMNTVFGKNLKIKKVDNIGIPVDRTLSTQYKELHKLIANTTIEKALIELQEYMNKYSIK